MLRTIVLVPLALAISTQMAIPDGLPQGGYGGHMWNGGYGMGFGFFGAFLMVAFWGGIIGLIVWALMRLFPGGGRPQGKSDNAEGILRDRLARGEIEPAEYQERMKALGAGTP